MGLVAAVATVAAAPAALGLGSGDLESTSVRQLQSPTQLPQTPEASVPVPAVPQVSVPESPSVPSVPSVPQTPSVPEVQAPSVSVPRTPGASAPSAPGQSTSTSAAPGSAAPGATADGTGSSGGRPGSSSSRASAARSAGPAARRAQARKQRRVREHRVRRTVRRLEGCFGVLTEQERGLLSLRAGLDGPPRTRGEAASELGIGRRQAGRLEQSGMRALRDAEEGGCGAGGAYAGRQTREAVWAGEMPAFQPTSTLAAAPDARPFMAQEQLGRGDQQVAGVEASLRAGQSIPPLPTHRSPDQRPLAAMVDPGSNLMWIALLGLLALLVVPTVRSVRAGVGASNLPPGAAAALEQELAKPEPKPAETEEAPAAPHNGAQPDPAPARNGDWAWPAAVPTAVADARPTAVRTLPAAPASPSQNGHHPNRLNRPAAIAASGLASLLARELMRRRKRR